MTQKKLMLTLSCGHTLIFDRSQAASAMSKHGGLSGTHITCTKCSVFSVDRRIIERSWIDDRKEG